MRPPSGNLLGTRLVLNNSSRFSVGPMKAGLDHALRHRHLRAVRFRYFSSIAIQIGGIGALAPSRSPIWRASACARWRPGRWPTSCRPALRE